MERRLFLELCKHQCFNVHFHERLEHICVNAAYCSKESAMTLMKLPPSYIPIFDHYRRESRRRWSCDKYIG